MSNDDDQCTPQFFLLPGLSLAADLSGSWALKGDISGYSISLTCAFKQTGTHLAGTCTGNNRPDRAVAGEVTDQKVKFQYEVDNEGNKMTAVYAGIVQPDSSIKGTVDVAGNSGDFTATKLK
ncbi:MAG: hypothetical protein M3Y07_13150 [Acidobacteriota bacterium]|nr:hypothetical protein [Acidobacteriota bacterium]